MTRSEVDALRPYPDESEADYVARVAGLLPNWPADVLIQWAHRHHAAVSTFANPLALERMTFRLATWKTADLPGAEVFLGEEEFHAITNCARNGGADECPMLQWVWRYMQEHGTWPRPVILLDCQTRSEPFLIPHRTALFVKSRRPYTLLEGHRRLALAHVLREQGALAEELPVWIVDVA